MLYQQGDVILESVVEVKGEKLKHLILAEGEVSGHCHEITSGSATLYQENDILYLRVESDVAELTHQEHNVITLPKGDYIVRRVQEFDHFLEESNAVKD